MSSEVVVGEEEKDDEDEVEVEREDSDVEESLAMLPC